MHYISVNLEQEKQMVAEARKDSEAFGKIFDAYYSKILNYILKRTGDVALSQDLSSEVFLKAFNKLWQFQFKGVSFGAWLYRIANNEIRMHFRGKKIIISLEDLFENSGFDIPDSDLREEILEAEAAFERHEDFLKIQKHIKTLPLQYQEVIALRFFEEKSLLEIAEILGKKEGTIKSLLSRGLQKLRDAMQPF